MTVNRPTALSPLGPEWPTVRITRFVSTNYTALPLSDERLLGCEERLRHAPLTHFYSPFVRGQTNSRAHAPMTTGPDPERPGPASLSQRHPARVLMVEPLRIRAPDSRHGPGTRLVHRLAGADRVSGAFRRGVVRPAPPDTASRSAVPGGADEALRLRKAPEVSIPPRPRR